MSSQSLTVFAYNMMTSKTESVVYDMSEGGMLMAVSLTVDDSIVSSTPILLSDLFDVQVAAAVSLHDCQMMHSRLFDAGLYTVAALKTALQCHADSELIGELKSVALRRAVSKNELSEIIRPVLQKASLERRDGGSVYMSMISTCAFIDLSDYVVSCNWADKNRDSLIVVRRSGTVSFMVRTSLDTTEMMALKLISNQRMIQEHPQLYFSLRQAPTSIYKYFKSEWLGLLSSRIISLGKEYSRHLNAFIVNDISSYQGLSGMADFLSYLLNLAKLLSNKNGQCSLTTALTANQYKHQSQDKLLNSIEDRIRLLLASADRLSIYEILVVYHKIGNLLSEQRQVRHLHTNNIRRMD
jgi:hypothetical protein